MDILIKTAFRDQLNRLPRPEREAVTRKLGSFARELRDRQSLIARLPKGFWVKKLRGQAVDIYEFRLNIHDRILFTYGQNLPGIRPEHAQAVVYLDYVNHDELNRKAATAGGRFPYQDVAIDTSLREDDSDEAEVAAALAARYRGYTLSTDYSILAADEAIAGLLAGGDTGYLYYLGEEQYRCLLTTGAVLLTGSAGSGKTSIGIHRLRDVTREGTDAAYFTYTERLRRSARQIYANYAGDAAGQALFFTLTGYCLDQCGRAGKDLVDLERFQDFYRWTAPHCRGMDEFDPIDVWTEIRGIIKGFMGLDWDRPDEPMLPFETYLNLSEKYAINEWSHRREQKETVYAFARRYQDWLDEKGYWDENDLARATLSLRQQGRIQAFPYLVADEIQDLSERQIFLLYHLVADPGQLFLSGDYHQTVNPTYFRPERITHLFFRHGVLITPHHLVKNYRSQAELVRLFNAMTALREELIGKTGNDYTEEAVREGVLPLLLPADPGSLDRLLAEVSDNPNAIVLVPDEVTKAEVAARIVNRGRLFTVPEIKGLEYRYVAGYNLVSAAGARWAEIFAGRGRRSSRHRHCFNLFYVGVTRAMQNVCLYEADPANPLLRELAPHFHTLDPLRAGTVVFPAGRATREDWLADARRQEENGNFPQAVETYRRAGDSRGVERCRAKQLAKAGDYAGAGRRLLELGEYRDAAAVYREAGDRANLLRVMTGYGEFGWAEVDTQFARGGATVPELFLDLDPTPEESRRFQRHYLDPKLAAFRRECEDAAFYLQQAGEIFNQ